MQNRAKKIALYGILSALCLVLGYLESLLPLDMIAPGIKLGLANAVALLLIALGDIKGAVLVNITRILLSALLFGSPFSLIFSLSGGIASLLVMSLLSGRKQFGTVGFSVCGAVAHNIFQLLAASVIIGQGVWYYLPVLLIAGSIGGILTGLLAGAVFKKTTTYFL